MSREHEPEIVSTFGVCGGTPRIGGTRITTENIIDAYRAGDSVADIALWYEVAELQVVCAIDFEQTWRGAVTKAVWGARTALMYAIAGIGPKRWRL